MDADLVLACERIATGVGGALAAKPLLERLLGPSFEYVGKAMADLLARYGNANVSEIFGRAATRLAQSEVEGAVHPRVLKAVIEDGSFASDPATQEYFAGLLSSAVGEEPDDAAVFFLSQVKHMSAEQVRLHHALYSLRRQACMDALSEMFVPHNFVAAHLRLNSLSARRSALSRLAMSGLIAQQYEHNAYLFLRREQTAYDGIRIAGTALGAELFLWVHGVRDEWSCAVPGAELRGWMPLDDLPAGLADSKVISAQDGAIQMLISVAKACDAHATAEAVRPLVRRLILDFAKELPTADRRWLAGFSVGRVRAPIKDVRSHVRHALEMTSSRYWYFN